jgi:4'-phosphopantetheinyl transferase
MNKISDVYIYQIPLTRSGKYTLKNINNNLPCTNSKNEFSAGLYFCSLILKEDFNIFVNKYVFNINGKPSLESRECGFNITYTNNYVYIAIVRNNVVGIDAEQIVNINLNISEEFMSKGELKKLYEVSNKYEYFYKIWTLKESYIKLFGKGIDNSITDMEFIEDKNGKFFLFKDHMLKIYFNNFSSKDCILSVASLNLMNYEIINFDNTEEFFKKYDN